MTTVPTCTATIYAGFKERPGEPKPQDHEGPWPVVHAIHEAEAIVRAYCDAVGLCATVTPTTFVYTEGREPGVIVGLINYPRFPATPGAVRSRALKLAELLRVGLGQWRVSVVFPDETVMLGKGPES